MHKVLIVNLTRLGDIVQSIPLLKALKRQNPLRQIHYLAVAGFSDICEHIPEIDRVIPFNFGSAVFVAKEAIRDLQRRLDEVQAFIDELRGEQYTAVINLSHSRISALICHALDAPDTRGLTLNREGFRLIQHRWAKYFYVANLNRSLNRINLTDMNL
ncbi:MAG: hypothetical protein ABH878_09705, partial [bacterium]